HPAKLHAEGKGGEAALFARNKLCALVRDGVAATSDTLLTVMLEPNIKLGTSTPKADPSGDYAFPLFARPEAIKPGPKAAPEAKALQLMGSASSATPPPGRSVYAWHVDEGRADIFLVYCTAALSSRKESPSLQIVQIPAELAVGADYGMIVLNDAPPAARA